MATIPLQPIRAHAVGPGEAKVGLYLEGASQSFSEGAPIVFSSGLATVCGADPVLVGGFAMEAALGLATNSVHVAVCDPGTIFEGSLTTGVGSTGLALATSQIDSAIGLVKHTSGAFSGKWSPCLTGGGTTYMVGQIRGLRDAVGDVGGRVYFTIDVTKESLS